MKSGKIKFMPTGIYQHKKGYKLLKNTGNKNPAKRLEVRKKISNKLKGNKNGLGNKSRTGMKNSEETKRKISLANFGRKHPHSEETKQLLRKIMKVRGIKPPNRLGSMATNETRLKMGLSHRGEKCHWWKGGITELDRMIRTCFKARQWRSDIFTRDNFTCQKCGIKGCYLEAHHIKSFALIIQENNIKTFEKVINCEELWNINNGITLCKECHKLTDNYKGKSKKNVQSHISINK